MKTKFDWEGGGGITIAKFVALAWASYGIRLTEDEVREVKDRWLSTYPEILKGLGDDNRV